MAHAQEGVAPAGALQHIVTAQQFTRAFLEELFALTDAMRARPAAYRSVLAGKVVATLFYEPSTRTRLSFEAAAVRLGGAVVSTENARTFSSAAKGETLEDTLRVVGGYADCIVMRHYDDDAAERARAVSPVPFINAGSGTLQHPTQALLDLYTIRRTLGRTEGLTVAFAGDLLRGRTVDSLVQVLTLFRDNRFVFVAPANARIKPSLRALLEERGIAYREADTLEAVVDAVDVLYVTRIQKERFESVADYERAAGKLVLTPSLVAAMRPDAIILHPLPRVDEIAPAVDADRRAQYFAQAHNGMWVRMALLARVCGMME